MREWINRVFGRNEPDRQEEAQPVPRELLGASADESPRPAGLDRLTRDLESDSQATREQAAKGLLAAGIESVPHLVRCLASSRREAAMAAAEILAQIKVGCTDAIPDLIVATVDRDARMRKAAGKALVAIDPAWFRSAAALDALPRIVAKLGKRCDADAAVDTLAQIGRPAVPHLVAVLANDIDDLRQVQSIQALARIGADAVESLDALESAFCSGPVHVRVAAAEAVAAIGRATPGLQLAVITTVRNERVPTVCRAAIRAAARIFDPPAAAAVIVWSLADSDAQVHEEAARALIHFHAAAVPALVRLMEVIPQLHNRQFEVIEQMLAEHRLSFQPKKQLTRDDFFVEATWKLADRRAADVLREVGPDAQAAVGVLISRVRSDDLLMRLAVVEALSRIAPHDSAVIAALERLADDKNSEVKTAANAALRRVGGNRPASDT